MKQYDVTLTADATVSATIRGIEANSPEEAEEKAFELYKAGEVSFHVYSVHDHTVVPTLVSKSKDQPRDYESPFDFSKNSA